MLYRLSAFCLFSKKSTDLAILNNKWKNIETYVLFGKLTSKCLSLVIRCCSVFTNDLCVVYTLILKRCIVIINVCNFQLAQIDFSHLSLDLQSSAYIRNMLK